MKSMCLCLGVARGCGDLVAKILTLQLHNKLLTCMRCMRRMQCMGCSERNLNTKMKV